MNESSPGFSALQNGQVTLHEFCWTFSQHSATRALLFGRHTLSDAEVRRFEIAITAKIKTLPNLTSVAPSGGGQGPYTQGPMRVVYLNCLKQGLTIDDLIPAVEPEEGWFAVPPGRPAPFTPGGQHKWCQKGCQGRRASAGGACSRCNKMKTKSKAQRKLAAAPY